MQTDTVQRARATHLNAARTAEAQIKEASELSEGNFNLGAYHSSTWRI